MKQARKYILFGLFLLLSGFSQIASAQVPEKIQADNLTGILLRYKNFNSKFIPERNVDVWLPPNYSDDEQNEYRVIYMHDGQNLFIPEISQSKSEWELDETLARLIGEKQVKPTIIVAVWNTPRRTIEFMPQRAFEIKNKKEADKTGESDKYLKFIVSELKPFIDNRYRTKKDRKNTFIMGSSMGGLMSLYAVGEYPDVFGGAATLSTHYTLASGVFIEYLEKHLPLAEDHRIFYGYGTKGLDANYEFFQNKVDKIMQRNKYKFGKNWITKKFPGGDHNEESWREQLIEPLLFLLSK